MTDSIEKMNENYNRFIHQASFTIFKNDKNYCHRLIELRKEGYGAMPDSVGLVVGPGAVLSSLPEIPCESIIVCDINTFVLKATKYTESIFVQSDNVLEYISKLYAADNQFFSMVTDTSSFESFLDYRDTQIQALGEKHVEYDQMRFRKCKEEYDKKQIYHCKVDVGDVDRLEELGNMLNAFGKKITFVDYSNVHEYADPENIVAGLENLPFNDSTVFLYSIMDTGLPTSQALCRSMSEYAEAIQRRP